MKETKNLKKNWNTISEISLLILTALLLSCSVCLAGPEEEAAASAAANSVKAKFGSGEGFKENIAKPLTTGEVPIRTIDNTQEAISQISCPGTQAFFELLINSGGTKDITFAQIAYDTNLDGTFDQIYHPPTPISGVCANGIISCDPGTWENCNFYKWNVDNNTGILTATETIATDLGGCYCFNSSCSTTSFFSIKNQILRTLGTGVAAALAQSNPKLATAEGEIEGLIIRYYAQNTGDCNMPNGTYMAWQTDEPEDYYQNSIELVNITENEVETQQDDPNSYFNIVTNSVAFTGMDIASCQITRNIYFDGNSCEYKNTLVNNCTILESDPACKLKDEIYLDANGNKIYVYQNFNPTGASPTPSCKTFPTSEAKACGIRDLGSSGNIPSNFTSSSNQITITYGMIGDDYWEGNCISRVGIRSLYVKYPEIIQNAFIQRMYWDDYLQIFVNDNLVACGPDHCNNPSVLPSPGADCERETTWDWYPNSNITSFFSQKGQVDIKTKLQIDGAGEVYVVIKINLVDEPPIETCLDWWTIERTYVCESDPQFPIDVSRAETISGTLNDNGTNNFQFTDPVTGNQSINMPLKNEEPCIQSCKLRTVDQTSGATPIATTEEFRNNPTSLVYIYRECVDGVCPANPGEVIVEDCKCLSDFNLAYSALETMRQAAIDMICSDGTKKDSGILH